MSDSGGVSREDNAQQQLTEEYLNKLIQEKQTLDQTPGFTLAQKLLLQGKTCNFFKTIAFLYFHFVSCSVMLLLSVALLKALSDGQ